MLGMPGVIPGAKPWADALSEAAWLAAAMALAAMADVGVEGVAAAIEAASYAPAIALSRGVPDAGAAAAAGLSLIPLRAWAACAIAWEAACWEACPAC